MLHLRVVTPSNRTESLITAIEAIPNVVNLVVLPGCARKPAGDVLLIDVPNELANQVLGVLRARGADRVGSITIERSGTMLSSAGAAAAERAPGSSSEAVVWNEVESRAVDDSELTASFALMMLLSMLIAAVGILTDSAILVIGAMVIGPEYGPLTGIAVGAFRRRVRLVKTAAATLAVGGAVGLAGTALFTLAVRAVDATPAAYQAGARPLTQFISHPDGWSVVVALLAGVAGTVSLTQAKPSALVGVFISVTTIPAAANLAVAAALGRRDEAGGALGQLALNLAVIVVAGTLTLALEQFVDRRRRAIHRRPLP